MKIHIKLARFSIILIFAAITNCKQDTYHIKDNSPLRFTTLGPNETGIDYENTLSDTKQLNIIEYLYYYNGGGVSVGDINNDGLEDIFLCSNQKENKLYLNKGNLKFEDISKRAGIMQDQHWSTGATIIDINNDGWKDIYVCHVGLLSPKGKGQNRAYINNGNGTFIEKAETLGLAFRGLSTQACWLDYDKDGDLDMYLLNHNIHTQNSYGNAKQRQTKDLYAGDLFFENKINVDGKFEDVTTKCGIYSSSLGYGLAVSAGDVNNDGHIDIYVGNDFHENDYLYINNGDKTFTESIEKYTSSTSQFSMGVDIADVNNDGYVDIFTTDMMPYEEEVAMKSGGEDSDQIKRIKNDFGFHHQSARNHFQINKGGHFVDIAYMNRMYATDWSWSVLLQDFNNDLYADVFITNGIVKRPNDLDYINYLNELDNKNPEAVSDRTKKLIEKMPSQAMANILFCHLADGTYSRVMDSKIGKPNFSTGAAYSDLDNDGDLDIVTNNINAPAEILRNELQNTNYLSVRLSNRENKTPIGSKVILVSGKDRITKELQPTRGFMSSSSHTLHFGLGKNQKIDSLIVIWPDRNYQILKGLEINKIHNITRGNNLTPYVNPPEATIAYNISTLPVSHVDNIYYHENEEKLVPEQLSNEGPALLVEDLDGDGIKDIFVGSGRNAESKIYFGKSDGSYQVVNQAIFRTDAQYEDVAAATIDFDHDGDLDLYIVSGGSDNKELDKLLEDRIYLNVGKRTFKRIPISLPHTNGSCISVADFDRDGYDDIFVGARSIPGFYGLSPYSFILKNLNGQGVDIMSKERFGMVADSKAVDFDNDKDFDLVICGDWMPVSVLINDGRGNFTNESKKFGTDQSLGMWNAVEVYDVNKDGKLDILAGNAGLNLKWQGTTTLPIKMYVGDFDDNGITEPIIFAHSFNRYMPINSMDKLISQMPFVKDKFKNYANFSKISSIENIFDKYNQKLVELKQVTELRSVAFISGSNSNYSLIPLPKDDQMTPIQDFAINEDGSIYYVSNYKNFIAENGSITGHPGAKMGAYDGKKKEFLASTELPLPHTYNSRHIVALKDRFIVAGNDEKFYILDRK